MRVLLTALLLASPVADVQEHLQHGRLQQARNLLEKLDGDSTSMDLLWAQLLYEEGDYKETTRHLLKVTKDREPDEVHLLLAQTYLRRQRYADALNTLDAARGFGEPLLSYWRLRVRSLAGAGRAAEAHATLLQAEQLFRDSVDLGIDRIWLYAQLDLREALRHSADDLLQKHDLNSTQIESVVALMVQGSAKPESLEQLAWREPSAQAVAALAYAYAQNQAHYAAAALFARASELGGDFAFEAADQFRMAGRIRSALAWNIRVSDVQRRNQQRFAIHMMAKNYAQASSMAGVLPSDEDTRYRLAYADYESGHLEAAARQCGEGGSEQWRRATRMLCQRVEEELSP